jgi:predicted nucleic acid-binding protein
MNKKILIDTSLWIEALKKDCHEKIKEMILKAIDDDSAFITGIIMVELLSGAGTLKKYEQLKNNLEAIIYLDTTADVWEKAAEIAFTLKRKGINVPSGDILIASVAIRYDVLLLHMDKHFELIGKNTDLKEERLIV